MRGYFIAHCSLLTFHYVCFAWVFFRAPTFDEATAVLKQIFQGGWGVANINGYLAMILLLGFALHFCPKKYFNWTLSRFIQLPSIGQAALLFLFALVLKQAASSAVVPFIYFQF